MAAKKSVSFRLDPDLAGWARDVAVSEGVSQADVVEAALRGLRADAGRGSIEVSPAVPRSGVCPAAAPIRVGGELVDTTDPVNVPVNDGGESREAFFQRISAGRMSFGSGKKA